jgi:hypothetical protein
VAKKKIDVDLLASQEGKRREAGDRHPPRGYVGSGTSSPPASTERDVVVWLLVAERPSWLRDNPLRSSSESASPWSTTVGRQKASTAKPSLSWTACGGNPIPTTRRITAACRPIARRSDGRRAAMIQSAVEGKHIEASPPPAGNGQLSPQPACLRSLEAPRPVRGDEKLRGRASLPSTMCPLTGTGLLKERLVPVGLMRRTAEGNVWRGTQR